MTVPVPIDKTFLFALCCECRHFSCRLKFLTRSLLLLVLFSILSYITQCECLLHQLLVYSTRHKMLFYSCWCAFLASKEEKYHCESFRRRSEARRMLDSRVEKFSSFSFYFFLPFFEKLFLFFLACPATFSLFSFNHSKDLLRYLFYSSNRLPSHFAKHTHTIRQELSIIIVNGMPHSVASVTSPELS